jgi:flagellar FliL protein
MIFAINYSEVYLCKHTGMFCIDEKTRAAGDSIEKSVSRKSKFVRLPEVVVNLRGDDEHYLLINVVLDTDSEDSVEVINDNESLFKSIMVSTLSEEEYEKIRKSRVDEVKQLLDIAFRKELTNRNIKIPYQQILIEKMVFQ